MQFVGNKQTLSLGHVRLPSSPRIGFNGSDGLGNGSIDRILTFGCPTRRFWFGFL